MAKKYECCMLYENRPGHQARTEIDYLLNNKLISKKIYPNWKDKEDKKSPTNTPPEVLENSKKYAIFLSRDDKSKDGKPIFGKAFKKDIMDAASLTRGNSSKKILYTLLDGRRENTTENKIVENLEVLLDEQDVPDERRQYIEDYDPKKIVSYISSEPKTKGVAKISPVLFILLAIGYILEKYLDVAQKIIDLFYPYWNTFREWINSISIVPIKENSSIITGTVTVVPVLIIWLYLSHKENTSKDPFFWLKLRRCITLLLLLMVAVVHRSAALHESESILSKNTVIMDFERSAVINLFGESDKILVPVKDFLDPSGKIWIEENGKEVFGSEFDKDIQHHLKNCPPLQEGHSYTVGWDLDVLKAGEKKFCHHRGEPIVIEMESISGHTDFQDITKSKLREMAEKYKIRFSEKFTIYSENGFAPLKIDIKDAEEEDRIFTVDIGIVCFRLKDGKKEETIMFGIESDFYDRIDQDIPSGHAAVDIEFTN